MCGASSQQNQVESEQNQFYQQAMQESSTAFSEQQALISEFENVYSPILNAGPNQQGFNGSELATLNAQAVEGTAENYSAAAKAVNENLAAEGGGDISLPQGAQTALKEQVAEGAAMSESQQETQIQEANYAQGQQNFQNASNALAAVSGELSPTAYEGAATSAGSATSQTANEIAQEDNSWLNAALGAVGTAAGGWAEGGFKMP